MFNPPRDVSSEDLANVAIDYAVSVGERVDATCAYLQQLSKDRRDLCAKQLKAPDRAERAALASELSETLAESAALARISNHHLLCTQAIDRVWISVEQTLRLGDGSIRVPALRQRFEDMALNIAKNRATPNERFLLKLFETNPIIGVVTAFVQERIEDRNAPMNVSSRGEDPTNQCLPIRGWYLQSIDAALKWHQELDGLFSELYKRIGDRPHAKRLIQVVEREFYRLWADSVQILNSAAMSVVHETFRPAGEPLPRLSTTYIYFPGFPRPKSYTPEQVAGDLNPLLKENYRNFTTFFDGNFAAQSVVHVPLPVTPELASLLITKMTRYTEALREAIEKGGRPHKRFGNRLEFTHGFELILRPRAEIDQKGNQAQARISILSTLSEFRDFNIRLDLDHINSHGCVGIPTLDFGVVSLEDAIKFATLFEQHASRIPHYQEQLDPNDREGNLKRERKRTVEATAFKELFTETNPGTLLSILTATLTSAGYLFATRASAIVGHHHRELSDRMPVDDFAAGVEELRKSLQKR